MIDSDLYRQLAARGAAARLAELDAERDALLSHFPELRPRRGPVVSTFTADDVAAAEARAEASTARRRERHVGHGARTSDGRRVTTTSVVADVLRGQPPGLMRRDVLKLVLADGRWRPTAVALSMALRWLRQRGVVVYTPPPPGSFVGGTYQLAAAADGADPFDHDQRDQHGAASPH